MSRFDGCLTQGLTGLQQAVGLGKCVLLALFDAAKRHAAGNFKGGTVFLREGSRPEEAGHIPLRSENEVNQMLGGWLCAKQSSPRQRQRVAGHAARSAGSEAQRAEKISEHLDILVCILWKSRLPIAIPRHSRWRYVIHERKSSPFLSERLALIGQCPVREIDSKPIRKLRNGKSETPEEATNWLKTLRALFKWVVQHEHTDFNPAKEVEKFKSAGEGFHTWNLEEVEQHERCFPIGEKGAWLLTYCFIPALEYRT
jgi:hypothetical protein